MDSSFRTTKTLIMRFAFALALLIPFVAQQASATDTLRRRACRVGTPNPAFLTHRAPLLPKDPGTYIGSRRQLVVMASFQDQDFEADHATTQEKWNKIFNAENFSEEPFAGSLHDYFKAQSYGQFDLTFDLTFVELPDSLAKYSSTPYHDENSQYLVIDIAEELKQRDIDWGIYDWDGDSYVDQLLIIYAGKGQNAGGSNKTIWPHQWWLTEHMNQATEELDDYCSYSTVISGDKEYYIDCYCCVQEVVNTKEIFTSFGTICHEYSHCFGLPDFYYGNELVVGEWDLMDYGLYNGGGYRPCGLSAHERMFLGWTTPVELTDSVQITDMPALCDEPVAYLVRNDGAENEYYIIENRQQRGWDADLPGKGILVFHIEYSPELWVSTSEYVNTSSKKRYSIFHANNAKEMDREHWVYPYFHIDLLGDTLKVNDQLTNTSSPASELNKPNTNGKLLMSKPITHMAVDADGKASFVFLEDKTTSVRRLEDTHPSSADVFTLDGRRLSHLPERQGVYISNGKVMIK